MVHEYPFGFEGIDELDLDDATVALIYELIESLEEERVRFLKTIEKVGRW